CHIHTQQFRVKCLAQGDISRRTRGRWESNRTMSALRESECYGLSSAKLSGGNVSVLHVKLTDSAARAIDVNSHPLYLYLVFFSLILQRISIPCSDNRDDVRTFTFGVTNVARDNPNGSFDCVRHSKPTQEGCERLSCLGVIQKKMTVNATDDSYDKARQSMAQAEEETRSRGAIVIKHGGRYQGRKQGGKHTHTHVQSPQSERPLRERLTHLLALRPYKRPELILRLQRDGLSAEDKDTLYSVVTEVGQLNSRDNTFVLKQSLYKELQKDWPGYTSGDQQLLKRILVRRLFQPQPNLLTAPEAQVSPLRDTPNSSPAHRPKLSLPEEYTDPLASKKPRISHMSSKTASDKSKFKPTEQRTTGNGTRLDPRRLFDSLSVVCWREEEVAERLESIPCAREEPESPEVPPQPNSDGPPSPLIVPDLSRHTAKRTKRKKSKHKHRDQFLGKLNFLELLVEKHNSWVLLLLFELFPVTDTIKYHIMWNMCVFLSSIFNSPPKKNKKHQLFMQQCLFTVSLHRTYTAICSHDQRQSYKQDFNKEYNEYRDLHARIDGMTRQFMELDTQLKQLHEESHKYKRVHNQILQEYRKIKKSNPNYNQDKSRCEYLHNKLAHIKKLISEYDKHQLAVDRPCPK
uniref:OCEL domain-containing protein n=1 Tax=Scophthalmus maximus TaxID=52904 RepID=A0A8D3CDK3_SCOMX